MKDFINKLPDLAARAIVNTLVFINDVLIFCVRSVMKIKLLFYGRRKPCKRACFYCLYADICQKHISK